MLSVKAGALSVIRCLTPLLRAALGGTALHSVAAYYLR